MMLGAASLNADAGAPGPGAPPVIQAETAEASKPWTGLEANDAPDRFHFVIVSDRTGGHRPGVFKSAMPKVNTLEPAFVVSVGDLIEGYTLDQQQLDREWAEFEGFIGDLRAPFFYAAGNHDMSNAVMAETWRQRFGPSYYHFVYKDVLFLVLNSELFGMVGSPDTPVPGPFNQAQQMQYVEEVLRDYQNARWTVVLTHQPLWDMPSMDPDWERVEALLGERPYTVFAGHYHRYKLTERHDRRYYTLATTGGGSQLRGPVFGEFDHVAWVTMTGEGPQVANLRLDGIVPHDVATEASRAMVTRLLNDVVSGGGSRFSGRRFRRGEIVFSLRNPNTVPLTVTPRVVRSENLDAGNVPGPITLSPGAEREVRLAVAADRSLLFNELIPARVVWSVSSAVEGKPIDFDVHSALLPLTTQVLPEVRKPVVVDGDLGEWRLTHSVSRQGDVRSGEVEPTDASFRFGLAHDADNLYLAVSVTDDSVVAGAQRTALEQDSVVVSFDARPEALRSRNMSVFEAFDHGEMNAIAINFATIEGDAPTRILGFLEQHREHMTWEVTRTDIGYDLELAVPHAVLDKQAEETWQAVRVSVHVADIDDGEHQATQLHWQPYRFGDAPVSGTGLFERSCSVQC